MTRCLYSPLLELVCLPAPLRLFLLSFGIPFNVRKEGVISVAPGPLHRGESCTDSMSISVLGAIEVLGIEQWAKLTDNSCLHGAYFQCILDRREREVSKYMVCPWASHCLPPSLSSLSQPLFSLQPHSYSVLSLLVFSILVLPFCSPCSYPSNLLIIPTFLLKIFSGFHC